MRKAHPRFQCYPSVVCVGTDTKITIFPRDISRRFRTDKEYELCVLALNIDETDYHSPAPFDHSYAVENGCLTFTHSFSAEQEYSIRFREKGAAETKLSIYAVEQDLYELRPLKGDLHTHSYYSDGQDGPAMIPASYREEGFDFVALTDHNRMYPSILAAELYHGIPLGIHLMHGEEIHTPGSQLHIVHVGGTDSVCDKYIHDRETYEKDVAEIEASLSHISEEYRAKTAKAIWACKNIHEMDGLAIFAHPMWQPRRFNVTREFAQILFDQNIFDALELMGGINYTLNNYQLALWQEQMQKGTIIPVVGSSDSHNHDFNAGVFGHRFTVVFAKSNTTGDILQAIKDGYSVAGEIPHDGGQTDARFYGSQLRLVLFAQFLYGNYFLETHRLCYAEGVLMRRYAHGEPVGELLAALKDTVENFYKKFYGLTPAPVLSPERLHYLDQCLKIQCTTGPVTKGSVLHVYGGNERRE